MSTRSPIAVVGMSCLFPGSVDKTGFWRDILAGKDLTGDVPASHWLVEDYYDADPSVPDKTYAKRGAFLDDIPFDPMAFGVPPSIVPQTDTSQLLALIVAKQVLEDASRGQFEDMDKERMGIVLGVTSGQELMGSMASRLQRPVWTKAMREAGLPESKVTELCDRMSNEYTDWGESNFPGLLGNVVAGRVANRLDLGGFNCVTDAACASSLSALQMAMHSLWLNESDVVIAGGVDTMNDIFMYMCFSKTPALSMTGDCRPFSADGDGTLLGEGLAMMALKRLEDAERDGDPIYSVIRGIGGSSDGKSKSVYAPVSAGQAKAIRRAYESADMDPQTVELLEAHGTGTVAGDAAEFGGLRLVFGDEGPQRIALGSVKSQIGHTKSTAGAAGLFKAVLALHSKVLPPTIKVDSPNPKMDIENSPFYLSTRARPWIRGSDHPRRAGVSAFGFGGSNFHVAVEEYTGALAADRVRSLPAELVVLTADSVSDLKAAVADALTLTSEDGGLAFLAASSQNNADTSKAHRVALTATDEADLFAKLTSVQAHLTSSPTQSLSAPNGVYIAHGDAVGQVGFVFPGQGSQYVDMGAGLAMHMDSARAVWDRAQDVEMGDVTLADVAFPMPVFGKQAADAQATRLTATEWAQPAIGAASLALLAVLREVGLTASMMAGHSFGEVTALAAAGAFDEETALRIARRRGELMRDAAQADGSMTAAKADIDAVRAAVGGIDVVVANHNGPTQVVLSGPTAGIEAAETALEAAGITFKRLPVATAFHSSVVASSADPFEAFLHEQDLQEPTLSVLAHATAEPYGDDVASTLGGAIAQPVRFVDQIEAMYSAGIRTFIEIGPGSVLTRLVGRILKGRPHVAIDTDRKGRDAMVSLLDSLARMVAAGVSLDLSGTWMAYETPVDPRTVAKSKFTMALNGANYGKPYPPKGGAAALPKPNPEVVERPVVQAPAPKAAARPSAPVPAPVAAAPVATAPQTPGRVSVANAGLPAQRAVSQSAPTAVDGSVASLVAEAQKRTAAAHTAYQQSMADAHVAFLATMQNAVSALTSSAVGVQPAAVSAPSLHAAAPVASAPVAVAPAPAPAAPTPVVAAAPVAPSVVAPVATAPQRDLKALVLDVVAESTGYPVEMLEPSMALESDLGIDSIKRVEILSAVQKAAPELPEVDAGALAALDTLQEVIDHLAANAPVAAAVATPAVGGQQSAVRAAAPQRDLKALVLSVVAESTGYPVEMLEPSMALESDLGIDSIKRVEILSAVQKAAPELPEVDAGALAALDTLQEVIDHLAANAPVAAVSAPAVSVAVPQRDLKALVLNVVAESTGYPVDMLEPSMALESDLGIDSIKRVEILSAVQKAAPELPEVDAGALAALDTLQEVIDHLAVATPAIGGQQSAVRAAAPQRDLKALVLNVVAESTGYPVDMLEPSMALESDLGIDSIKRVEILSAVQKAAPELPEVDAGALAALDTLQEVIDHLADNAPVAAVSAPAVSVAVPQRDLKALVLNVVAESTGYPVEMLEPSMALESDLGIDSIKRVEILSAVQKAAPQLPEVDAGALAALDTLQEVIDHLAANAPGASSVAKPSAAAPVASPTIGHFATRVVAAPVSNLKRPGLQGRIRITKHASDVATGLASALTELGYDAATVDVIDADTDVAIFTGGLVEHTTAEASVDMHAEAILAAKTVAASGSFITLQSTGGDFGLSGNANAWSAGLTGLIKTAAIEWPGRLVKAIDVDREDVVAAVVAELRYGGPELEVGLRADGSRVTLESVPVAERVRRVKLDANDVIVVSGGARGVTAACVIALATQTRSKFVLLGRSALADDAFPGITDNAGLKRAVLEQAKAAGEAVKPADIGRRVRSIEASREVHATLNAIRKAGGEAMYCVADVSDADAVARAVAQGRQAFGTISGLIHGAGVLADRFIADKTEEQARFVLGVKLLGLQALLSAVGDDSLKVLAMFSSVAGRAGNRGQSDYAMANEVLNRVASQYASTHKNTVVRSIGWGPWAGGMVDASLKARFDAAGVALIDLHDGARRFVDELTPGGDVELVIGGAPSDGALLADDRPPSATFDVRVDKASHPWLVDHTISDVPVLPVVMCLEWFVRAARAFRPELSVSAVEDVKVRRGVTLPHFYNGGDVLQVDIREAGPGQLAVSLTSADPRAPGGRAKHYDATVAVQPEPEDRPDNAVAPSLELAEWTDTIYGDVLFHGPDFQVITELDGVADNAIQGTLEGVVAKNWPLGFQTDAAALDGGIQLAVLWNKHAQGGAFLPTGIRRYVPHDPVTTGPIRCTVRPTAQGNDAAVSDIEFVGLNGERIASLQGVQTHRRPNGL